MRKGVDLINYQNHSTHQNMTKKTTIKKQKPKTMMQEMGEYLDMKMSKVTTFEESVDVLNRTLNHIDDYERANA